MEIYTCRNSHILTKQKHIKKLKAKWPTNLKKKTHLLMELNIAQLALVTSDYCHRKETNTPDYSRGNNNRKENQKRRWKRNRGGKHFASQETYPELH